jgi:hypothetical protein
LVLTILGERGGGFNYKFIRLNLQGWVLEKLKRGRERERVLKR